MGNVHPGRWALNHALAQNAAGMDVEIISQAHKATCDFDCVIEGIPVHFLRTYHPYRHFTFYLLDSIRIARRAKSLGADIVHAHGTEAAYGWAAQRSGLPYCITAQGLFFQILPTLGRRPSRDERFLRWGEHLVLRRARHVIAKSEYVRDALTAEYPHLDLSLIPNTYEPCLDTPLSEKTHSTLAFVGTMDQRKGVHIIAKALPDVVKEIPDLVLHIAGNPDEAIASGYTGEQLRSLRATLGDRLILHGKVSSRDLFALLSPCTALVAPSLEEMFGNQLIEAMMRGCHGIVTDHTAMAENVHRFGNGTIVPQEDAPALAAAIVQTLRRPPTRTQQEEARQRIRDYMSPETVAQKHRNLYQNILETASRKR